MYEPPRCFTAATILQIIQGYLNENLAIIVVDSWGGDRLL